MSTNSFLQRMSDERAALVQAWVPRTAAIFLGRRRAVSGIRWNGGFIVTAAEAVGGAEQVDVRIEGDEIAAEVLAADLTTDVAVLKAGSAVDASAAVSGSGSGSASGPPSVPAPGAGGLRLGEAVLVAGRTPGGPAAAWGNVQLTGPAWHSLRGGRIEQRIELDVRLHPELEGAAIVNMSGEIAGMAVCGVHHRVLGIPASTIDAVVSQVARFGRLPRPYLGIRLQPLWLDEAASSKLGRKSRRIAAVGGVDAGSPAERAQMELGDLVLTLDGEPADGVNGLARRIAGTRPGQTIALEVLRGGKPMTIQVEIGERPRH